MIGDTLCFIFYKFKLNLIEFVKKNSKRTVPGNGILHVTFDSALIPIAYSLYRSRGRRRVDRPRNDGRRHFLQAPGAFVLAQMPEVSDGTKNI